MKLERGAISVITLLGIMALGGCGAKKHDTASSGETKVEVKPTVVTENPKANDTISTSSQSITVIGSETLDEKLSSGELTATSNLKADTKVSSSIPGAGESSLSKDSLYIQIPVQLLGQGHLFGGVITTVSDRESETLGRLKLTDLPPMHVRPYVAKTSEDSDKLSVVLVGCVQKCAETSEQQGIIALPVVGQTNDQANLVLDVSKFGEDLDLMSVLDPEGAYSGLKTQSTRTTAVDMTDATIVWDVEHTMVPKDAPASSNPPVTLIGARYYLKLESALNSSFVSRRQVPGVGFFTTQNREEELITRFSTTEFNGKPIHYFVKNVPAEHQAAFASTFDAWNATFKAELDRELISYEFVNESDPKSALLVTGDARYNILEWDLVNKAPYGGLGPSIASQTTGEIFSANVLIQGPEVVSIYKEWFQVSSKAQKLIADGKTQEADALIIAARNKIFARMGEGKTLPTQKLSLGKALSFRHNAQDERLQDRLAARQDFFDIPRGETYESYMKGYFHDMVTHELGHNLGLRHNFKGNLLATTDGARPSGSIMEYLNREFRHKDTIGVYDHMAIKYGYGGALPIRKDTFCTDENVVDSENPTFSAECSRDDATSDSFAYLSGNLDKALDRIAAPKTKTAPTWTVPDLTRELNIALTGTVVYATSAKATSDTWLNWNQNSRPQGASEIPAFVFKSLHDKICAPEIRNAPAKKTTAAAKAATVKNLADLDEAVSRIATQFKIGNELKCL